MDALAGIDLGTTGIKAVVCSPQGEILGESYLEYALHTPAPGVVEQDAEAWWALAQEVIRLAVQASPISGREIGAISISSQGISFVPVDQQGQPLRRAMSWLDTRAEAEAELIRGQFSDEQLFRMTGKRASPAYVLPKLLWLRQHEPDLYGRTHKFLMAHDYVMHRLCGRPATDHSMAGGTLLYDIQRLGWSPALLAAFDIDPEQLPTIAWSGSPLGTIRPEIAQALGLSEQTLVAVGGQDQKCAALGAGIRPGVATVSLGTASAISCLTRSVILDPERRIPLFPFVVPGYWDLEGVVGTAGGALRWLRETLFPNASYATLDSMAATSPPGANGVRFYPHLSGAGSPHWRADVQATFVGLSLATGAADIVRSVLEGVAFQIRENLDVLETIAGRIDALILFGGGAQSPLWTQIISDIAGKPVAVSRMIDVANWGACVLAGRAAGLFGEDPLADLAGRGAQPGCWPRAEVADQFASLYQQYRTREAQLLPEPV